MRLRRALLAFVVVIGLLVLFVGVTGILLRKPEPAPAKAGSEASARREDTIDDFQIKGDIWLLKAKQARMKEGGGMDLVEPTLEVERASASGEERLTVRAREGTLQLDPEKRVHMSGGPLDQTQGRAEEPQTGRVRVEFAGTEKVVLMTPTLEVEPDQGTGHTADEVEMVADAQEGRQRLWGKGAEFASKERRVVVHENIRMELSGAGSGIFPQGPSAPSGPAGAPVTNIVCRGPATADGFTRTVELNNDVRVQQGENTLRADRLEVQLAENGRTPERVAADGAVTFKASGAEGACDHLLRHAADDQLVLEGKPARVHRGTNEIEANRIELSGQKGVIVVPVPGRLTLSGEESAQGDPGPAPAPPEGEAMVVKWSRMLRLDSDEHKALFLGDVHFERADQTIECQTLTVTLDSENRRVLKCTANTDVRLAARLSGSGGPELVTGQGRELTYDPEKDSLLLTGSPFHGTQGGPEQSQMGGAVLKQGEQTIRGERIEVHPKEAEIAVAGAGRLEGEEENDSGAFSVSWEREMRFSRAKQSAVFGGGVVLEDGADTLRAENVTARLSENALKGFDATGLPTGSPGSVELHQAGRTLNAERLSVEMGPDRKLTSLDASGHVRIRDEVEAEHLKRTLTADRVVSATDEKTQLQGYEATGQVTLREDAGPGGVRTMRASRMTAKLDAQNQPETFEGTGRPVTVEGEGRLALGDRLMWDARRDSGTLFGAPAELRMGQSRVFGDRLDFAPKRGDVTVVSSRRVEAAVVGEPGAPSLLPQP